MYAMHPHGGYSLLRGEKGDTWESGVRVPGIVWWPGTIEAGQDPIDIVQVTDMFTTAASIAGVKNEIPNDRVTDGVDQSALLLLGEGKSASRQNSVGSVHFVYFSSCLKATPMNRASR